MTVKGYIEQEQAEGLRNDLLRECWFECHWAEVDRAFSQYLANRLAAGKLTTQRLHEIVLKRRKTHRLKTGDKVMVERYDFGSTNWIKGVITELGRNHLGMPTYVVRLPKTFGRLMDTLTVEDLKSRVRTVEEHKDHLANLLEKRDVAYAEKTERRQTQNVSFRLKVAKEVARHLVSKTDVITYFGMVDEKPESLVEMIAEALKKAGVYSPQY